MATKHNMSYTPTYRAYIGAKGRCNNPNNTHYEYYGGRGIKFCFDSFPEFYKEIGEKPPNTSLDRIDTNGNYELGNIKWSTQSEQLSNRRSYFKIKRLAKAYLDKPTGKYRAIVSFKGKKYHTKRHKTRQEAMDEYNLILNKLVLTENNG
jgi:hypothetical protein